VYIFIKNRKLVIADVPFFVKNRKLGREVFFEEFALETLNRSFFNSMLDRGISDWLTLKCNPVVNTRYINYIYLN
jgi:hypothetical protein